VGHFSRVLKDQATTCTLYVRKANRGRCRMVTLGVPTVTKTMTFRYTFGWVRAQSEGRAAKGRQKPEGRTKH